MTAYALSPRARTDLTGVWRYSAENWNVEQADRYVRKMHAVFERLARDPRSGRSCDHIRRGYRMYPVESHMVFFRLTTNGVDIIRILHQKMDFQRHLLRAE